MLEHVVCHAEAVVHEFEGREEDVLEQLKFTMVSMWHVAAEKRNLVFLRHDHIAFSSHDLPYVWVLLMRHYAGSGRELVREFYEPVIRTHVHTAVCCELVECQCDGSHCGGYCTL